MKITKTYTILFFHAGIRQYERFFEKDGILYQPRLSVSYFRGEIPSVEDCKTIDDALKVIQSFSPKARIHLINGNPVNYHNNTDVRKKISNFQTRFSDFITTEVTEFFQEVLEPIMIENEWFIGSSRIGMPILIEKDKDGEWDNIADKEKEFDFEYICREFMIEFKHTKIDLTPESYRPNITAFPQFIGLVPSKYLTPYMIKV